jgi:hypothetical protein
MRQNHADAINSFDSEADGSQGAPAASFQTSERTAATYLVPLEPAVVRQPVERANMEPSGAPEDSSQIARSRTVGFVPRHVWYRIGRGLAIGAICITVFSLEVWLLNRIPEARPTVLPTSATPMVSSQPVAPTSATSSSAGEAAATPQRATSSASGQPAQVAAVVVKVAPPNEPKAPALVEPRPRGTRPIRETVASQKVAASKVPAATKPAVVKTPPAVSTAPVVSTAPAVSTAPVQADVAVKRAKATADATADAAVPPTSFKGAVGVESQPEGARVFVDRKLVGFTPIVVPDLVAGSHVIRVETDTHGSWTSVVRVVADEVTRVAAQLRQSTTR